jgi:hypothetical protein
MTFERFVEIMEQLSDLVRRWLVTFGLVATTAGAVGWGNCQRIEAKQVSGQFNQLLSAVQPKLAASVSEEE